MVGIGNCSAKRCKIGDNNEGMKCLPRVKVLNLSRLGPPPKPWGEKTIAQLSSEYEAHATQINA